mmetsp:Transcript_8591/g.26370  ORF Transcript_8591/g.26370 Transcript_8591/m.26370 type:complete len:244 (-) Transcript_8591:407-1138(-)
MALHYVLDLCKQESAAQTVATLLLSLKTGKIGDGSALEVALACALILRAELLRTTPSSEPSLRVRNTKDPKSEKVPMLPAGLIDCMTSDQSGRRVDWEIQQPQSDLTTVLDDLTSDRNSGSRPLVKLVYPATATFETYDLFLVFYPAGRGTPVVYGYQCKKGRQMDVGEPDARLRKSFLVRGDAAENPQSSSTAATNGWILVTKSECMSFMGPTLWPILKFEDVLPRGDTQAAVGPNDEDTAS